MIVWIKRNILRMLLVKCIIFIVQGNTRKMAKTIHADTKKKSFTWSKREYILDLKRCILDRCNNPILYYDLKNVHPISLLETKKYSKDNSKLLRDIMLKKVVSGVITSNIDIFMLVAIIGLVVGIVALAVFSIFQIQALQQTILELTSKIPKPPIIVNP